MSNDGFDENSKYRRGLELRRQVQGAAHVDRSMAAAEADPFMQPIQQYANEVCWGHVWAREGLDLRTRSAINIAMLAAMRMPEELRLHVRSGLINGLTPVEIQEILLQATMYAGIAAGTAAFRAAKSVLDEEAA